MSEPLLILHLSDLHFGNKSRFAGQDMTALGQAFHKALDHARKERGITSPVGLVLVTGDVTETGKPKEFQQGADFLEALASGLGLEAIPFNGA
jgi:3',5'-cyclic AMP phosphodiesterase CpdA